MKNKPIPSSLKGKEKLVKQIMTPPPLDIPVVEPFNHSPDLELFNNYKESSFDWQLPPEFCREYSQDSPVSLGDDDERPIFYYEGMDGDYSDDNIYSEKMDIDDKIVDIAGLPAIETERYVSCSCNELLLTTVQCTS